MSKSCSSGTKSSLRHFSDSNTHRDNGDIDENAKHHRRGVLKYGRARRKWESKKRLVSIKPKAVTTNNRKIISKDDDDDTTNSKAATITENAPQYEEKGQSDTDMMFGFGMGNPIRERYIRNQRKVSYPTTLHGWKTVLQTGWGKYLWTFEGFLRPEKNRLIDGKIVPMEKVDDDVASKENEESLRDKATEAADTISHNVQKNIVTMKEEAPKLLKIGQDVTGISTRVELREWASAQLKLGTECLSQFMRGYRKGRDDEIDRMLHEYFKDLDDDKESSGEGVEKILDGEVVTDGDQKLVKRKKRVWGRQVRRKLKEQGSKPLVTI